MCSQKTSQTISHPLGMAVLPRVIRDASKRYRRHGASTSSGHWACRCEGRWMAPTHACDHTLHLGMGYTGTMVAKCCEKVSTAQRAWTGRRVERDALPCPAAIADFNSPTEFAAQQKRLNARRHYLAPDHIACWAPACPC